MKQAKQWVALLALGAGCLTAGQAQAVTFYESFDNATSSIPDGWQVEGNNPAGLDLVGGLRGGLAIDLDGTDTNPGAQTPTLSKTFSLTGGTRYNVKFDLITGVDNNYVDVAFGSYSNRFYRQGYSPSGVFRTTTHAFDFTPASDGTYALSFVNQNIDPSDSTVLTRNVDFLGAYLDNVKVWDEFSTEPAPVTQSVPGPLPLLGAIAAFRWSRKLRARVRDSQSSPSLIS